MVVNYTLLCSAFQIVDDRLFGSYQLYAALTSWFSNQNLHKSESESEVFVYATLLAMAIR